MKLKDKFWFFGTRAHDDDIWLGKNNENRFTQWSRITPAEGAAMLGVPNMLLINCDGIPVPFSKDAYGFAESFCWMKKVMWSSVGSAGVRAGNEEAFICELAEKYPNICGSYLDDFFGKFRKLPDCERSEKALAALNEIRVGLDKACRPMEMWTTWYTHEFELFSPEVFEPLTGVTMWTWNYPELPLAEERIREIERVLPGKGIMLGCYIYDYPSGQPVPLDMMEYQCELGRRLIKERRIEGMILEANSVMGVGLPSDYWLRDWIDRVGDEEI